MPEISILLADDDHIFQRLTSALLAETGYKVHCAHSTEETQKLLNEEHIDIMMLDMCFPAFHDGFNMLSEVHESYPDLPVLMISGSGHIPDAVHAIKNGATDFIEKPIDSSHLLMRLKHFSERIILNAEKRALQITAIGMKGVSQAMQKVFSDIVKASQFDSPVLITGETGVGKELAAHAIHRLSRFGNRNMITINCASIPKELFEAELFGYTKGAFTGAVSPHKGYF